MANSPEEIEKHRKAYTAVGIALFVFTGITVAVARIDFFDFGEPGISALDVAVGLAIALFKSSLVALIFMHLNHEKGLIYKMLLFTCYFAFGMMLLMLYALWNPVHAAF
ncbi:MAG: cytochrome C oxidase subunit IV family protein [Verrucomicrobiales bacterium]|nr:cytochrome C oxidase subunit IV family protein [Verrucomicrobiales bacterium]